MLNAIILIITSEVERGDFDDLCRYVSEEKYERIKRFHFFQDARNCLLGDILTRIEICRLTGLSNQQIMFSLNDYGKPYIVGITNIHYNISHSGKYIAFVVSDEPVGIDIELIKFADFAIAKRFFSYDEVKYIIVGESHLRFYEIWTMKESMLKLEGKGLSKSLDSFSVFDSNQQVKYTKVFHNKEAICHICSMKRMMPSIKIINIDSIIQVAKKNLQR